MVTTGYIDLYIYVMQPLTLNFSNLNISAQNVNIIVQFIFVVATMESHLHELLGPEGVYRFR